MCVIGGCEGEREKSILAIIQGVVLFFSLKNFIVKEGATSEIMSHRLSSHPPKTYREPVPRGVFNFELNWEHYAAKPRKIFLFPC